MKIVVATNNKGKLKEFSRVLSPLGIETLSLSDVNVKMEVLETGETFLENAILKAEEVSRLSGFPAIGDDSGLMVDALNGAPGVYTARYAGENATDEENIEKLLCALKNVPDDKRGARFICALALIFPNGERLTAEGECPGKIGYEKKGDGGFGYDPIFYVKGGSFSEISDSEKDRISHRGIALRHMAEMIEEKKK